MLFSSRAQAASAVPAACPQPILPWWAEPGTAEISHVNKLPSAPFMPGWQRGFFKMSLFQVLHSKVGICLIWGFVGPLSLKLVLLKRKSGEVRHTGSCTVCHVAALLKIVLSRALGRRWTVVCGHATEADLTGNVRDGEPFTPASHLAGKICPVTISPHPRSQQECCKPPLEKCRGIFISQMLG